MADEDNGAGQLRVDPALLDALQKLPSVIKAVDRTSTANSRLQGRFLEQGERLVDLTKRIGRVETRTHDCVQAKVVDGLIKSSKEVSDKVEKGTIERTRMRSDTKQNKDSIEDLKGKVSTMDSVQDKLVARLATTEKTADAAEKGLDSFSRTRLSIYLALGGVIVTLVLAGFGAVHSNGELSATVRAQAQSDEQNISRIEKQIAKIQDREPARVEVPVPIITPSQTDIWCESLTIPQRGRLKRSLPSDRWPPCLGH